ncbi:MAG: hypothetical protein AB4040_17060 [Synechococcus sp.]
MKSTLTNSKANESIGDLSVITAVTELHNRFKNAQSHYATIRGNLLSQLEEISDGEDESGLKKELGKVNEKINYFRVLSHSLSIADTVLHTDATIDEFGPDSHANT